MKISFKNTIFFFFFSTEFLAANILNTVLHRKLERVWQKHQHENNDFLKLVIKKNNNPNRNIYDVYSKIFSES